MTVDKHMLLTVLIIFLGLPGVKSKTVNATLLKNLLFQYFPQYLKTTTDDYEQSRLNPELTFVTSIDKNKEINDKPESRGVVYSIFGKNKKTLKELIISVWSLKNNTIPHQVPHVTVFADLHMKRNIDYLKKIKALPFGLIDSVVLLKNVTNGNSGGKWLKKVASLKNSPYDLTVYLDTDTFIIDAHLLPTLFELIDKQGQRQFQLVGMIDWVDWENIPQHNDHVFGGHGFPISCAGVLVYRSIDSLVKKLLNEWLKRLDTYENHLVNEKHWLGNKSESYKKTIWQDDQAMLHYMLQTENRWKPLRLWQLPMHYQCPLAWKPGDKWEQRPTRHAFGGKWPQKLPCKMHHSHGLIHATEVYYCKDKNTWKSSVLCNILQQTDLF